MFPENVQRPLVSMAVPWRAHEAETNPWSEADEKRPPPPGLKYTAKTSPPGDEPDASTMLPGKQPSQQEVDASSSNITPPGISPRPS